MKKVEKKIKKQKDMDYLNKVFFDALMNIIFTKHAEERIKLRGFSSFEIIEAIKHPDKTIHKYGKQFYQKKLDRGLIEVCCEKTENNIKVITVYWL